MPRISRAGAKDREYRCLYTSQFVPLRRFGAAEINAAKTGGYSLLKEKEKGLRPRKKVKLSDIAERMGVSVVTVSNALAGRGGVGEELRARIEACARELGYLHTEERKPAEEKECCVLVLFPETGDAELPEEIQKIGECLDAAARKKNIKLQKGILAGLDKRLAPRIRYLSGNEGLLQAEGLLVCGEIPSKELRVLKDFFRVPVIGYGFMDPSVELDYLMDDGFRGIKKAVHFLLDAGCRDIMYMTEDPGEKTAAGDRFLGFTNAMYEFGLIDPGRFPEHTAPGSCGPDHLKARLLKGNAPQGVVCSSEEMAQLAAALLSQHGLRVPEDVMVTGYRYGTGQAESGDFFPSCQVPLDVHAERSLDLLRKRISRGGGPDGVRLLECEFLKA